MPAVCKLPALEHKNWFDSYSTGQELQVWPLAIVTSGYLLPLKFVTTFFIKREGSRFAVPALRLPWQHLPLPVCPVIPVRALFAKRKP